MTGTSCSVIDSWNATHMVSPFQKEEKMPKLLIMLTLTALLFVPWGRGAPESEAAPQDTAIATLEWLTDKVTNGRVIFALEHVEEAAQRFTSRGTSLTLPGEGLFAGVTVDVATVSVGGDAIAAVELRDLNGDGSVDWIISYDAALVDSSGSVRVCAQGVDANGEAIEVCGDMQVAQP